MDLEIKMNLDDDAIKNNPNECRRILNKLVDQIVMGFHEGSIMDVNGNTMGDWRIVR